MGCNATVLLLVKGYYVQLYVDTRVPHRRAWEVIADLTSLRKMYMPNFPRLSPIAGLTISIVVGKSTSSAAQMLMTFNGHAAGALRRQSSQKCYYPSYEVSPYDIPCGTGEAVVCCPNEWTCEDNGLCSLPSKQYYGLFSCTDWSSGNCPQSCVNGKPASLTATTKD